MWVFADPALQAGCYWLQWDFSLQDHAHNASTPGIHKYLMLSFLMCWAWLFRYCVCFFIFYHFDKNCVLELCKPREHVFEISILCACSCFTRTSVWRLHCSSTSCIPVSRSSSFTVPFHPPPPTFSCSPARLHTVPLLRSSPKVDFELSIAKRQE